MSNRNGKTAPAIPQPAVRPTYPIPPATRARIAALVAERDAAAQAAQAAAGKIAAILDTVTEIMGIPRHGYGVNLYDLELGIYPTPEEPTPDPTATLEAAEPATEEAEPA